MSGAGFDRIRRFDEIDSTNRYLLDEARAGAPEGLVAVADYQTGGPGPARTGVGGPAGGGPAGLGAPAPGPAARPAPPVHRGPGPGRRRRLRGLAGVEPGLKWPNDLVVGGGQAGRRAGRGRHRAPGGPPGRAVVVGIGMNVAWPGPAGGRRRPRCRPGRPARRWRSGSSARRLARRRLGPPPGPGLDDAGEAALVGRARRRCATLGRRVGWSSRGVVLGVVARRRGHGSSWSARREAHTVSAGDVVHVRPRDARLEVAAGRRGPPAARRGRAAADGSSPQLAPMRLLVTGGAGFIGSNFVRYWVERHPE